MLAYSNALMIARKRFIELSENDLSDGLLESPIKIEVNVFLKKVSVSSLLKNLEKSRRVNGILWRSYNMRIQRVHLNYDDLNRFPPKKKRRNVWAHLK